MAHQFGVANVVATMGTALNARHVKNLRSVAPRVVLVFDADAGGNTGVDRALEIFVSQEVDLAIATLPEGLDPCDLLVQQGPEPFQAALSDAVDALDFKLNHVLAAESATGIEGRRRALDSVLGIIALAPEMAGPAGAIKRQLVVTKVTQRLLLKEEDVWARLKELRARVQARERKYPAAPGTTDGAPGERRAPAAPEERQLLEVLLADPALVGVAAAEIRLEQVQHPGLRQLLQGLYDLLAAGDPPSLDLLRPRIDNPHLATSALEMQELGRQNPDRPAALRDILAVFRRKYQLEPQKQELKNQLHATSDHAMALEKFRRLQQLN
jgi:DNA primase